ncbi:hypothetical protein H2198_009920 [Neophaeococcomyces mojaviensis]|uniref:Uncharacterized protein n=1 Tax=Neophaeococcomyces mojaviensis TaxID=3383035 RepID=A0ACC2ZT80_9EURO|nr:hypothetical protein H2198_009920 [Knufia sp. JES_112]
MSSLHVALVGATGNLGPAILDQLTKTPFIITVLTRVGSGAKVVLPSVGNVTVEEVDYDSPAALVAALKNVDVVISTLGFQSLFETQKKLIDASIDAGVTRFIPSEFGNDSANPNVRKLPVFAEKVKTQDYLLQKVSEHPSFSYTFVYNNSFFDWQLKIGFMVNLKEHTATLYDGGDVPFSATRLSTIGKALVAVASHLEGTKNRHLYVHDTAVTQNKLIALAKAVDGKQWTTTTVSTADVEQNAHKLLESGSQKDLLNASLGFIARACWGSGYGGDFTTKLNNDILGIPLMSDEEVETMVREIMAGL